MKRFFTLAGFVAAFTLSANVSAQEKQTSDKLEYKSEKIQRNAATKTVVLEGNVEMKCKGFSLKKADKAVIDEAKNTVTIYNPSDIKFLTAKTIAKTGSSNVIVYNLKEESITYQ